MFSSKFNIGVLKHPGYNVGGGIGEAALIGAAFGGAKAIATGQDPLEAALLGGITGGAMSGVTGALLGPSNEVLNGTVATPTANFGTATATDAGITNLVNPQVLPATETLQQDVLANSINNPALTNSGVGIDNLGGISTSQGVGVASTPNIPPVEESSSIMGNANQQAIDNAAVRASAPTNLLGDKGFDLRTTSLAPEGSMVRQGLDFYAKQGELGRPLLAGAAGYGIGALEPKKPPELPKEEKSKLAGYDPEHFTPYDAPRPNPYPQARYTDYRTAADGGVMHSYAQGGIAALADGGQSMGGNQMYPQGMQDHTQYATPSQMPTSAEVVDSGYEMKTDPYMGTPTGFAEGGIARYAYGGSAGDSSQVFYDSQTGQYYTRPFIGTGFQSGYGALGIDPHGGSVRNYIGADGRPVDGGGGKFGDAIASANGNIGSNFQASQATPNVYQQAQQAPMAEYNPNPAQATVSAIASPSYDAMMQGVAPQDFNRVFSQVTSQAPQAPQEKKMAQGGIASFNLGGYASGGNPRLLKGPGDGMSDNIPATIGGRQPARLADGEFVVPADVVSHLGNGSTDAGAKHLYAMMDKVRKARTGRKAQGKQINPAKYLPA